MEYLHYDVITKVRIVGETEAEFPRITICNLNRFHTEYAMDMSEKNKNMTLFELYQMSLNGFCSQWTKKDASAILSTKR